MINGLLLASYSFSSGGAFGDLLNTWENMGFFDNILPFILIFSVVFGVLSKTKLFEDNKSINAIIALAVGFMSLRFGLVPAFFSELFPNVGIGIAILLVIILFLGIFLPKESWAVYVSLTIAAIVVISVLINSSEAMGWQSSFLYNWSWGEILVWVFLLVVIIAVIGSGKEKKNSSFDEIASPFLRAMHK